MGEAYLVASISLPESELSVNCIYYSESDAELLLIAFVLITVFTAVVRNEFIRTSFFDSAKLVNY